MLAKNDKIYIAGHGGLVGSAIVRSFKAAGYTNLILKTREELDLLNQNAVTEFFKSEQPQYVVLAAAKVGGIAANMSSPADFLYENLQIETNVIWQAHLFGVKKLLFLASSCIYPRECPQPMKEDYLLSGKLESTNEGYALAKISGLKLCEYIYQQFGKDFISCMPTNIYGPGDHFDSTSTHVIPALIRRIHEAKINNSPEAIIWGSGLARREFLHVDDLATAVLWLMESYDQKEFLNVGIGIDVSIKELALAIKEVVGYKGQLVFDTSKPDGMPKKLLDVNKINKLGWHYNISFDEGLRQTYKWFLDNVVSDKE
jgi:GDP-L-fucose synthase